MYAGVGDSDKRDRWRQTSVIEHHEGAVIPF